MVSDNNKQEPQNQSISASNEPQIQPQIAQPYQAIPSKPVDNDKTLSIVGLVLAFLIPVAGIVVSAIALYKSKKNSFKNGLALTGLILSIMFTIIGAVVSVIVTIFILTSISNVSSGNFIIGNWDQSGSGLYGQSLKSTDSPDLLEINSDKTMMWYHDKNDKSKDFATGTYTIEFGNKTNNNNQYTLDDNTILYTLTFKLNEYVDTEGETHNSTREIVYIVMYDSSKSSSFSAIGVDKLDGYTFIK